MNVSIYAREEIEQIIVDGSFPENTAVISFYDPAIKRIDKDYTHVDYSRVCHDLFYSELDDLDLEVLKDKGYTYDTYFPEVNELAEFICRANRRGKDIICQCEYGQSRSAGCAAAILEHFHHTGISIFTDYRYYPNQVVYHKVFNALERQKRYAENRAYFAADAEIIHRHLTKLHLPESLLEGYQPENADSAVDLKYELEKCLTERHQLYHTAEEIINALLTGGTPVYASFTVEKPHYLYDRYLWDAYAVRTVFKYGCEEIPVDIRFSKYRISRPHLYTRPSRRRLNAVREHHFSFRPVQSLSFFGWLSWDSKRKMIDAVPLIITNIR